MKENELQTLKEQIMLWKNEEEYRKIADAVEAIPEEERDADLEGMLAEAYHELQEENAGLELYEAAEMEVVEEHISKCFGAFENVFHEIVSPDIHVDICVIPPNDDRNYYTLVTMGMGAHRMNVPKELAEYELERAELLVALPPDWKLDQESMADETWYWPVRMLKSIARLKLNARFQPQDRHELEDALDEVLEAQSLGQVDGGGTMQMASGEISYCDIEINLKDGKQETLEVLARIVNHFGVPKGSQLQAEELDMPVGEQEGMAVYMNGTDLEDEVYQNCDINYAVDQMEALMEGMGRLYSYWEGPRNTALYFYGISYEKMLGAVKDFLEEYPLCRKCVVEQIA